MADSTKYENWDSGKPYTVKAVDRFYMACCDCNLVHRMKFEPNGKDVKITVWRVESETRKLRRKKKKV